MNYFLDGDVSDRFSNPLSDPFRVRIRLKVFSGQFRSAGVPPETITNENPGIFFFSLSLS